MISPGVIPQIPGDMDALAAHAAALSAVGASFPGTGQRVHSTFQQLAGVLFRAGGGAVAGRDRAGAGHLGVGGGGHHGGGGGAGGLRGDGARDQARSANGGTRTAASEQKADPDVLLSMNGSGLMPSVR